MGLTVAYAGSKDETTDRGTIKMRMRKVTFDSSYPTGGEAIAASDFGLSRLHSVVPLGPAIKSDVTDAIPVAWNPATGKLAAYRQGAVPVTINVTDADGAAAAGVALYVHVDEVLEQGTALAHLEFVSPTNADGTGTVSNGGATYYVQDDDDAATGGVALYFDEDGTAGGRFLANTGRDCYVMLSNGDFLKVTADASPGTAGVQVYFDEDAANSYQRALFVSPTNANGSDTASATLSLRSATALAEVANATSLASYSVHVLGIGL